MEEGKHCVGKTGFNGHLCQEIPRYFPSLHHLVTPVNITLSANLQSMKVTVLAESYSFLTSFPCLYMFCGSLQAFFR